MRLLELFAGTGSIGRAFRDAGWDVVSLDLDPKAGATITADFMQWDYEGCYPNITPRCYESVTPQEGYSESATPFDCIWASPPCTHYSIARTTARTPRDLEGSDRLVQRVLDCIEYFKPKCWFMENPQTGYLKGRRVVQGLRYRDVSYCVFGFPYRKPTRIWTNLYDWDPPAMCCRARPCEASRETGRSDSAAGAHEGRRGAPAELRGQAQPGPVAFNATRVMC